MAIVIREIEVEKDRRAIESLWDANVASNFSGRYEWLYKKSPYGEPLTIIAEDDATNTVVGCTSIFQHVVVYNNQRYKYGIAYDFIVHEKYRVFGPAVKLQKRLVELAMEKDYQFILGFPNKAAQGVIKRVGYTELGKAHQYSKVLNASDKIKAKLGKGIAARIAGAVVNLGLVFFDRAKYLMLSSDYALHESTNFNSQMDISSGFGNIAIIEPEKVSDYLNWRYVDFKGNQYKIIQLLNKSNNKISGYCVYYITGVVAVIVDIKLNTIESSFNEMMVRLALKFRKDGIASITMMYLGNQTFIKCIKANLFILRPETRDCYIHMNESFMKSCGAVVGNVNNWMLLDADMDL